jgi:hypothetical protein
MIQTDDSSTAKTYLGDITMLLDTDWNDYYSTYGYAVLWRAGRSSVMHQVYPLLAWQEGPDYSSAARQLIAVSGSGGGRIYGYNTAPEDGFVENPGFRYLQVTGTTAPLTLYGANPEHAGSSTFFEFDNASNIRVFGTKTEDHTGLMRFSSTSNVMVSGITGFDGTSMRYNNAFTISGCNHVTLSNLNYYATIPDTSLGYGNFISDATNVYSGSYDWVMYKVGSFDSSQFQRCGDGFCDGAETPANCSADCR